MTDIARDGDLAIRRLTTSGDDLERMARWLSDERVLEFYGGRDAPLDLEGVTADYGPLAADDAVTKGCLIELDGEAIGYIQYYRWADHPGEAARLSLEMPGAFGIDLFIGEPALWDRGLGTRAIGALSSVLFASHGATLITLDPQVTNARAIRAYEKAGFRKLRMIEDSELHEGERRDLWLMALDRP